MESDDKPVPSLMTLAHTVAPTHERGYAAPGDLDDEQKAAACEVLACAKTTIPSDRELHARYSYRPIHLNGACAAQTL